MSKVINISNIGTFTRLTDGNYKKHRTSQFMGEGKLDLKELAYLILENSNWYLPKDIKNNLNESGWIDEINFIQKLEESDEIKINREKLEIEIQISQLKQEKSKIEESILFQKYFENWIKKNEHKYSDKKKFNNITEKEYWAAREFIYENLIASREKGEVSTKLDISIRRIHQSAMNKLRIWNENKYKDLNLILEKINTLKNN